MKYTKSKFLLAAMSVLSLYAANVEGMITVDKSVSNAQNVVQGGVRSCLKSMVAQIIESGEPTDGSAELVYDFVKHAIIGSKKHNIPHGTYNKNDFSWFEALFYETVDVDYCKKVLAALSETQSDLSVVRSVFVDEVSEQFLMSLYVLALKTGGDASLIESIGKKIAHKKVKEACKKFTEQMQIEASKISGFSSDIDEISEDEADEAKDVTSPLSEEDKMSIARRNTRENISLCLEDIFNQITQNGGRSDSILVQHAQDVYFFVYKAIADGVYDKNDWRWFASAFREASLGNSYFCVLDVLFKTTQEKFDDDNVHGVFLDILKRLARERDFGEGDDDLLLYNVTREPSSKAEHSYTMTKQQNLKYIDHGILSNLKRIAMFAEDGFISQTNETSYMADNVYRLYYLGVAGGVHPLAGWFEKIFIEATRDLQPQQRKKVLIALKSSPAMAAPTKFMQAPIKVAVAFAKAKAEDARASMSAGVSTDGIREFFLRNVIDSLDKK